MTLRRRNGSAHARLSISAAMQATKVQCCVYQQQNRDAHGITRQIVLECAARYDRISLKRLDRLLSNTHLASEREALYAAMAHWLIRYANTLISIDLVGSVRGL